MFTQGKTNLLPQKYGKQIKCGSQNLTHVHSTQSTVVQKVIKFGAENLVAIQEAAKD